MTLDNYIFAKFKKYREKNREKMREISRNYYKRKKLNSLKEGEV